MAGDLDRHRGAERSGAAAGPRSRTCSPWTIPAPREIIVVSDGSTDDTASARSRASATQVRLIDVPPGGKPLALNVGGRRPRTGDILVFADARQMFAPGALPRWWPPFAIPAVGGVTGELLLDVEAGGRPTPPVGDGVGLYWRYEKQLRRNESRVWSTLGATGAIYALRRRAGRRCRPSTLLDDVLTPMRAVLGGYRVVFEEQAIAFDRASTRRRRRVAAEDAHAGGQLPDSRAGAAAAAADASIRCGCSTSRTRSAGWSCRGRCSRLLISSLALATSHPLYAIALAGQGVFYGLALAARCSTRASV